MASSGAPNLNLNRSDLLDAYEQVRTASLCLCAPLNVEDYVVQSMPDVSPTKWHLAHTAWFFETFILRPHAHNYRSLDERYAMLFNSYYESVGSMHPRAARGLLSRPTVDEVLRYRAHVDEHMLALLQKSHDAALANCVKLGINHEQQHQELMLSDIKHVLSCNPLAPAYCAKQAEHKAVDATIDSNLHFIAFHGGIDSIGADGHKGFCFDNELPRHQTLLKPFALADRLVTNEEYQQFMRDGAYQRAEFWLADGWSWLHEQQITRPLYWCDDLQSEFTLHGDTEIIATAPVCHLSFYEADAFARWATTQWNGARLPSEQEWEVAARALALQGNFVEQNFLRPRAAATTPMKSESHTEHRLQQMFGDVWEWTASPYVGYPGYRASKDALGEYNGKFMCNQFVLRGGSCVTVQAHIRSTYRNFFPPQARWQFSGLRLAADL